MKNETNDDNPSSNAFTSHPELNRALTIIADYLQDAEIPHVIEASREEGEPADSPPRVFTIAAYANDYINSGLVGWNDQEKSIKFIAFDNEAILRAEAEGMDLATSRAGWDTKDLDTFILHLNGTAREIIRDFRAAQIAAAMSEPGLN